VLLYDGISKFINIEESLVASDDEELRSKKYIQELLEILAWVRGELFEPLVHGIWLVSGRLRLGTRDRSGMELRHFEV
jgi:hypothetical protein